MLRDFHYKPQVELVFGQGVIDQTPELVKKHGGSHVLLVTDSGLMQAGHPQNVLSLLEKEGVKVSLFDQVIENPTTDTVNQCVDFAKKNQIDFLIGLGGGSSLDSAKGCNFVLTNGGEMKDYWGVGKATKPMLPLIAIPTTAGTGSECQSFALISDAETHTKMACGDPKAAAKVAILDPALTLSQPKFVTACTGIDALVHALETVVTTKRNPISTLYAMEAFRLGHHSLLSILKDGAELETRSEMLLAAAFAGTAIENSMLGAAHATANPLTANYDTVHGQAVGLMIPHVMRFNAISHEISAVYKKVAINCGMVTFADSNEQALDAIITYWQDLMKAAGLHTTLSQLNIPESDIPKLSEQAAKQWTGNFNPRPLTVDDITSIYQSAL